MILGIDASNLRSGGGVTHLVELLGAAEPAQYGFEQVLVWSGSNTLDRIADRPWLLKSNQSVLNQGLAKRVGWQRYRLSQVARDNGCTVLFVPGGSFAGVFQPFVTMSRNLLPFEWRELCRYGWSRMTLKLMLLRCIQTQSFRRARGVIFLNRYAMQAVTRVTGPIPGQTAIIPHGLSPRFCLAPKAQKPIVAYSPENPFRLLYVSIIDQYKHQWQVVRAVAGLREAGLPVALDLVGPAYPPALARLQKAMTCHDPQGQWALYHGSVPHDQLHQRYAQADLGVFASSCENMPNILLETMASGLPIACSNRGPMPEILRDAGVYFDPENPDDIHAALHTLIVSPELRTNLANAGFVASQQYSWERCASRTFDFLADVGGR